MTTALVVGCGALGLRVARLLRAEGMAVSATTRSAERARGFAEEGITPFICDILDIDSLVNLTEFDAVLFAVASDRTGAIPPRRLYLDGLSNVLDRLGGQVGRFVLAGSTGVYGQTDGTWVDEDAPTEPANESGRLGLEVERLLRGTLPGAVILRFAGLYGPERLPRRRSLERGEPVSGDPEHWLNLIHLDDAARFAVSAMRAATPGPLYVASDGHPVSRRDFYTEMATLLRLPGPVFGPWGPVGMQPGRDATNKRVRSDQIKRSLGLSCEHVDYRAGLRACLAVEPPQSPGAGSM